MQAFDIARSLGIACTLTPNMMVTATVPDKLAVMSFVYQMYQYFNKATQSAITRQSSRTLGSGTNSPTGEAIFIHKWLCIHIHVHVHHERVLIRIFDVVLKTISTCMLNHSTARKFLVVSCQSITLHVQVFRFCIIHSHFPTSLYFIAYMHITIGEESRKSPSSPFDIKKFEVFASRNSPVTTAPPDVSKVSMYSRHSRDNSQTEIQLQQQNTENIPRSISPILAQQSGLQVKATEETTEEPNNNQPNSHQDETTGIVSTTTVDSTTHMHHSTPKAVDDDTKGEERDSGHTVSPRTSAKLKLDELVSDHAYLIQPEEDGNVTDERGDTSDRTLEYENLDESSSEPPTSSTVSLLDDDDSRCVNS